MGSRRTLYAWDRWTWYVHGVRVGGISKQGLDVIFAKADGRSLYEMGREVGEQVSMNVKLTFEIETKNRKNWPQALREIEQLNGWGNYLLKNNPVTVIAHMPPAEFMRGFLEGFLGTTLKLISEAPLRYEIQKKFSR